MSLPSNVHVSQHPCVRAKLSQLRSKTTSARETKLLVHELATMIGYEALAQSLQTTQGGQDKSPLGYEYTAETIAPSNLSLVPILRSGLGMVDGLLSILPTPVPTFHLGMYREKSTLQPVEYYNNLPYHNSGDSASPSTKPSDLVLLLDPIIATGATSSAAIDTLRDWGVGRILVIAILASREGLAKVSAVWSDNVEIWVCGVDDEVNAKGMIVPGLGDVGDRLFGTIGK